MLDAVRLEQERILGVVAQPIVVDGAHRVSEADLAAHNVLTAALSMEGRRSSDARSVRLLKDSAHVFRKRRPRCRGPPDFTRTVSANAHGDAT